MAQQPPCSCFILILIQALKDSGSSPDQSLTACSPSTCLGSFKGTLVSSQSKSCIFGFSKLPFGLGAACMVVGPLCPWDAL